MVEAAKHEEESQQSKSGRKSREVSRLSYPYYDLGTALEVVETLYNQAGGKASFAQLASYLGHKDESSGAFVAKVFGAKLFGLVNIASQNISTTSLGERLASAQPGSQRDLRLAEAFLNVPLFGEVYKRFQNKTLPSTREGLLNVLQDNFGVPSRRAPVALKTLLASAEQAGFKRADPNRLIHPVPAGLMEEGGAAESEIERRKTVDTPPTGVQQGEADLGEMHPAVRGFLQALPTAGQQWTESQRERWINAFVAMVKALYPSEDEE
jgi:hypothetical protein